LGIGFQWYTAIRSGGEAFAIQLVRLIELLLQQICCPLVQLRATSMAETGEAEGRCHSLSF